MVPSPNVDLSAFVPSIEVPTVRDDVTSQVDELDIPLSDLFSASVQVGVSGSCATTTRGGEDLPPVPEKVVGGTGAAKQSGGPNGAVLSPKFLSFLHAFVRTISSRIASRIVKICQLFVCYFWWKEIGR